VNSLPKTDTRQRRDCDLNLGASVSETSTLTSGVLLKMEVGIRKRAWQRA